MKLKFAFGIATAAMLFVGCGDDSVTNINDEAKAKGQVTLKIVDSNTGVAIDSAEVYSLVNSKSMFSDAKGVTAWKKNDIGTYEYTITKEGYATRTVTVDLLENSKGDMARVEDKVIEVPMYKIGVSVKGTVLLANPQTGNQDAAAKVTVILKYTDPFIIPQEVETITDKSGVYEFEDLAEGLSYTVSVPQYVDKSFTYAYDGSKNIMDALRSGEKKTLEQITMSIVGLTPELIKSNFKTVDVADSVQMTFSVALNADSVANAWKVYKNGCESGTEVLVTASLGSDNKTISVAPVSKEWTKLASYCLVGSVFSKEGRVFPVDSVIFVPGSAVSQPENVKTPTAVAYYDDYIQLSWEPLESEVKGFKVFYKTNNTADYVEYLKWPGEFGKNSLPVDSTKCRSAEASYYSECEEKIEEYGDYARRDVNYYWYTKHKATSNATQYNDDMELYYKDSTSVTYMWNKKVETDADDLEWSTSVYQFVWTSESIGDTCSLTYSEYYDYYDAYSYAYRGCPQYSKYGTSYTNYSNPGYTDDERPYYIYIWKTTETLATPDTCLTSYSSYSYCDQYSKYGTTPESTIGTRRYYKEVPDSSTACTVRYTGSSDYDACEKYEESSIAPPSANTKMTYWHFTYTDSTSCTVKSNSSFDTTPSCQAKVESLEKTYDKIDYTYFWYTKYANVKPTATDSKAFIPVNNVLNGDANSVKFIILPYATVEDDIIMAPVEEAVTTNAFTVKTEEEKEEPAEESAKK